MTATRRATGGRPAGSRLPLIAGNWKMNLTHLEAIALVQKVAFSLTGADHDACEVVVLPPFVDLRSVQTLIDGDRLRIRYGGQDLSPHTNGAYTGDVSGAMLAALGCTYVLVGHSERRGHHGETDAVVNHKLLAAVNAGLTPVLCLGEGSEQRAAQRHVAHCTDQVRGALAGVPAEVARTMVVAYEPVWAIGTGQVATPDDVQEVCAAVRAALAVSYSPDLAGGVRLLYGGSVKAANAAALLDQPDVDGALVGGASLDAAEFAAICRSRA